MLPSTSIGQTLNKTWDQNKIFHSTVNSVIWRQPAFKSLLPWRSYGQASVFFWEPPYGALYLIPPGDIQYSPFNPSHFTYNTIWRLLNHHLEIFRSLMQPAFRSLLPETLHGHVQCLYLCICISVFLFVYLYLCDTLRAGLSVHVQSAFGSGLGKLTSARTVDPKCSQLPDSPPGLTLHRIWQFSDLKLLQFPEMNLLM